MKKIYVASSWRNYRQPHIVQGLRIRGFEAYDFRCPESHFRWEAIDSGWRQWTHRQFVFALMTDKRAQFGFDQDMKALREADAVVLVLPCGRSSHLELGWAIGQEKPCFILLPEHERIEAELMYKMTNVLINEEQLYDALQMAFSSRSLVSCYRCARKIDGVWEKKNGRPYCRECIILELAGEETP